MEDSQIIELYFRRSEDAIAQTAAKYGSYCHTIAYNILQNTEDSEECVNDTYYRAWDAIPPSRPGHFSAFLGRITRNLSLDRYRLRTAEKRGGGEITLALEELRDCVADPRGLDSRMDEKCLTRLLDQFLASLPREQRKLFMRRYWYFSPVKQIAADFGVTESKVKMSLYRSRTQLKRLLEKEGIPL